MVKSKRNLLTKLLKRETLFLTIFIFGLSLILITFLTAPSPGQYSDLPSFGNPQESISDIYGNFNCDGFLDQFYSQGIDELDNPSNPGNSSCDDDGNCQVPPGYSILCAFDSHQDYADVLVEGFIDINYGPVVSNSNFQPENQTYFFIPLSFQSENPLDQFQAEYGIPIFNVPGEQEGWTITGDQNLINIALLPGFGQALEAGVRWAARHADDAARLTVKLIFDGVKATLKNEAVILVEKYAQILVRATTEYVAQYEICTALAQAVRAATLAGCIEAIGSFEPAIQTLANKCHEKGKLAAAAVYQSCIQ